MKDSTLIFKAFLFCLAPVFSGMLFAQNCDNVGFESADFTNWEGRYGVATDGYFIDYTCPAAVTAIGTAGNLNNINTQHTIVTPAFNGGVDLLVPMLSVLSPFGNTHVARLGDFVSQTGTGKADNCTANGGGQPALGAQLSYKIDVTPTNDLALMYYAIVLEDPDGHNPGENPYFLVEVLDPNGVSIECAEYLVEGDASIPGFQSYRSTYNNRTRNLQWRDWTIISIPLDKYHGEQVTINITATDCGRWGHLGYAYVDLECSDLDIVTDVPYICGENSMTLTAPDGMQEYAWYKDSTMAPSPQVGSGQTFTTQDTGMFFCKMTPYSTAVGSCPFDVGFRVRQAPSDPTADFEINPNPTCLGDTTYFTDLSTTENGTPIRSWLWDFGDGTTSTLQHPFKIYTAAGTYDVSILVESEDGCLDSLEQSVEIIEPVQFTIEEVDVLCETEEPIDIVVTPQDTGRIIGIGINADGKFDPGLALQTGASPFLIKYEIDSLCVILDSIEIEVIPKLEIEIDSIGAFCSDDPVQQLTANLPNGIWEGAGVADATNGVFAPELADSGLFEISYRISELCGDTAYTHILVNPRRNPEFDEPGSFCTSDSPVQFTALQTGGVWSGNGVSPDGIFSPAVAGVGSHRITYTLPDPCGASLEKIAYVSDQLDANFTLPDSVCTDAGIITLSPVQPGGRWSGPGISTPSQPRFNPESAGEGTHVIQYLMPGSCGDTVSHPIVVIRKKDATINPPINLCPADDPYQLTAAETGGVWSGTGITDPVNGFFDPSISGTGQFTITYTIPNTGSMCGDSDQITITVLSKILATIHPTPALCDTSASIQVTAVNPNGIWSGPGITDATLGTFDPIIAGAGTHTIQYLIPGNCGDTSTTTIVVNHRPTIAISPVSPLCPGVANIQLAADTLGGVWFGSGVSADGEFASQTLPSGTYAIKYVLGGNCPSYDTSSITIVPPVYAQLDSLAHATCSYLCDGYIRVQAEGGNPGTNYNHIWTPAQHANNTNILPNICAGTYDLTVVDNIGCFYDTSFVITKPDPLAFDTAWVDEFCSRSDGLAWVENISGGTAPYQADWGTHGIQDTIFNLSTGTYAVNIIDVNNCELAKTVVLGHINGPSFTASADSASCYGYSDGSAAIDEIEGGAEPYRIVWSAPDGLYYDSTVFHLPAGTVTVSVTDANDCSASKDVIVWEPPLVSTIINLPFDTICDGQSTTLIADATGGNGAPYTYYWAGESNRGTVIDSALILDETADVTVFARDRYGCLSNVVNSAVHQLPPLVLQVDENTVLCQMDTVQLFAYASGGNGNYQVQWPNGSFGFDHNIKATTTPFDTIPVIAILTDGCSTPTQDDVWYSTLPIPNPDFEVTDREGCAPFKVTFSAFDLEPDNHYEWSLGGLNRITPDQPTVRYEYESGVYDIGLKVTNRHGCPTDTLKYEYITVHQVPEADFYWTPNEATIAESVVYFFDNTDIPISHHQWTIKAFNNRDVLFTSQEENPDFQFEPVKAKYWIHEYVATDYGCSDTIIKLLKVEPEHIIYIPNAFTPNGDGLNDSFFPKHFGLDESTFNFYIFDRWGEMIFHTKEFGVSWDGTVNGQPAKPDVYEWMVTCKPLGSLEDKKFVGMVTLVK